MSRLVVRTSTIVWLALFSTSVPLSASDDSSGATEVARLGDGEGTAAGIGFDPKGKWVAVGGHDGFVHIWSVPADDSEPEKLAELDANSDALWAVAVDPSGEWVAAGGDGVVRIWRTRDWKKDRELSLPPGTYGEPFTIFTLAFSSDGRELIAGGMSRAIKRWTVPKWKPVNDVAGHMPPKRAGGSKPLDPTGMVGNDFTFVQFISMDEKGRVVATGGRTKSTKVWVRRGKKWSAVHEIDEPDSTAHRTAGAVSPNGKVIVVGGSDGSLWWIDTKSGKARIEEKAHPAQVGGVVFGPKGKQVITAGDTIRVWDVKTRKLLKEIDPDGMAWRVATSTDGEWLAVSFTSGAPALYRWAPKLETATAQRQ